MYVGKRASRESTKYAHVGINVLACFLAYLPFLRVRRGSSGLAVRFWPAGRPLIDEIHF